MSQGLLDTMLKKDYLALDNLRMWLNCLDFKMFLFYNMLKKAKSILHKCFSVPNKRFFFKA